MAVSRKKDTPEITGSKEIVFRKIIKKPEDILRNYLHIIAQVTNFKDEFGKSFPFYIYVSVNARDSYKATHTLMTDILHWFYEDKKGTDRSMMYKRVDNYFYSALMKPESRTTSQKYFIIDYDEKTRLSEFIKILSTRNIYIEIINETKNGYHIKTKPFDVRLLDDLKGDYPIELKKDALFFVQYIANGSEDL
jgi:hypothetical protein